MEYMCLVLQILLLFGTILFPAGDAYLYMFKKTSKNYLVVEIVAQSLFIVASIIMLFISKKYIVYMLYMDIVLAGILNIIFSLYSRNKCCKKLKEIIVIAHLAGMEPREIRRHILEKHKLLYSVKDIEKTLSKL